ncbi:MAG: hypothetical protein Q7S73_01955 [bacterium]|nr:hypothetical protein [bacterium]
MKTLFAILLISAFASIAVFGIFAMNQGEHAHNGCIAETANGALCPDETNIFASIAFHLNTFKNFSSATSESFMLGALLAIFIFTSILRAFFGFLENFSDKQLFSFNYFNEPDFTQKEFIRSWLSLHENSPSAV